MPAESGTGECAITLASAFRGLDNAPTDHLIELILNRIEGVSAASIVTPRAPRSTKRASRSLGKAERRPGQHRHLANPTTQSDHQQTPIGAIGAQPKQRYKAPPRMGLAKLRSRRSLATGTLLKC